MKQKKSKAPCYFAGGDITSVASSLGSLAASYAGAASYEGNPMAQNFKPDFSAGMQGGLIGLIPQLIKAQKDKQARASYVPTATPGNYQQGGPIESVRQRPRPALADHTSRANQLSISSTGSSIMDLSKLIEFAPQQVDTKPSGLLVYPNVPLEQAGGSSKSKSRNRIREKAYGGIVDDEQLSSDAFQVQDNPNVRDGKYYPTLNANLDHNEVVKNRFVFSNRIKNPQTGESFAEDAEKLQKSVGKSEKILKTNPRDAFANNTINVSNARTSQLAAAQEAVATMLGHRSAQPQGMAYGGPTSNPYDLVSKAIYDLVATNNFDPRRTQRAATFTTMGPSGGPEGPVLQTPSNVLLNYENNNNTESSRQGGQSVHDPFFPYSNFPLPGLPKQDMVSSSNPPANPVQRRYNNTAGSRPPVANSPLDGQAEYDRAMYEEMQRAANNDLPALPLKSSPLLSMRESTLPTLPVMSPIAEKQNSSAPSSNLGDKIANQWTAGDALQALEVASKFGQLVGGPDREMPNFDTTRVTKENYSPANAFYQTNRTLQNALNTIDAPSVNLRRAISNSLYAQKLGQDNNIMSEYNRMNQGANTSYEQRVSDQRRYNIGQTNYTEDLNQRNLDTYRNAVQNAFTSLGNFGQNMNQKKQGVDALNILKKTYPQVYQRIMEEWLKGEQAKTSKS